MPSARLKNLIVVAALFFAACPVACGGNGNVASAVLKQPELPTDRQAKCKVSNSQAEPLIVEWPETQRAKLESLRKRGVIAVHSEGCELAVLSHCRVKGSYGYSGITRKQTRLNIKDTDELYATMPAFAASLEAKLHSAGQLNVQMTVVGRYETQGAAISTMDLEGDCKEATHVVTAVALGAYALSAGADAETSGSAKVVGIGGGARSTASRELLQRDGDENACGTSMSSDSAPPEGCGAPLQLELRPIAKASYADTPAEVGDTCSNMYEGAFACSHDKKKAVICRGGKFTAQADCKGRGGCSMDGARLHCDATLSDKGEACERPGTYACTQNLKEMLICSSDMKWDAWRSCRGIDACQVKNGGNEVNCDVSIANDQDRCGVPNQIACSVDHRKQLICRGGKFVVDRGCAKGCSLNQFKRVECN